MIVKYESVKGRLVKYLKICYKNDLKYWHKKIYMLLYISTEYGLVAQLDRATAF